VVLGLLCLALLIMLMFMKSSLGSDNDLIYTRVARKLVWAIATSQYPSHTDNNVTPGTLVLLFFKAFLVCFLSC